MRVRGKNAWLAPRGGARTRLRGVVHDISAALVFGLRLCKVGESHADPLNAQRFTEEATLNKGLLFSKQFAKQICQKKKTTPLKEKRPKEHQPLYFDNFKPKINPTCFNSLLD